MFRKNYFLFFFALALFGVFSVNLSAQVASIRGRVELKKADGTVVPVADATVDALRTDIKSGMRTTKTNKRGEFNFEGVPFVATLVLSISAPNVKPDIFPNIKVGMEDIKILVFEGDGRRLTEEEARQATNLSTPTSQSGELTAEQKKAQEEYEKKVAEIESKNKNVENINAVIERTSLEGDKQFKDKNYDAAIQLYEEGYNADPEFVGTAAVFLNKKATALVIRATDKSNGTKGDPTLRTQVMPAVKKDFEDAVAALEKSLQLIKTTNETDPRVKKGLIDIKAFALERRKEAYRLLARTGSDRTKGKEAQAAYQEYIDSLTDEKLKIAAQVSLAETLQESNEFDSAIAEFEKVLAVDPNNVGALAGISLNLVNVGYMSSTTDAAKGKAQLQQASNYLQKFLDVAPDTHPYKADAKALIETLKNEQKIAPQKSNRKKQ